ncbi:MAG TPA: calcium/sodium antiporter, partial [Fibrobacter sp.]|nr:calcium/sodium antiporter [Fibrobacter sp.]
FLENQEPIEKKITLGKSVFFLILGLVFLIISSRLLVWGAVSIAHYFGVSDLLIGLTIVAIGTSLPELASSIAAVRKGENDIALGNILGSNLFNTLAVVGIAGLISPMKADPEILYRDLPIMAFLTLILIPMAFRRQKENRINRISGFILVLCYASYIAFLIVSTYAAKAL